MMPPTVLQLRRQSPAAYNAIPAHLKRWVKQGGGLHPSLTHRKKLMTFSEWERLILDLRWQMCRIKAHHSRYNHQKVIQYLPITGKDKGLYAKLQEALVRVMNMPHLDVQGRKPEERPAPANDACATVRGLLL